MAILWRYTCDSSTWEHSSGIRVKAGSRPGSRNNLAAFDELAEVVDSVLLGELHEVCGSLWWSCTTGLTVRAERQLYGPRWTLGITGFPPSTSGWVSAPQTSSWSPGFCRNSVHLQNTSVLRVSQLAHNLKSSTQGNVKAEWWGGNDRNVGNINNFPQMCRQITKIIFCLERKRDCNYTAN